MNKPLQIACDTHVHCYQFEQLPALLDSAVKNFEKYTPNAEAKVLFFTDGFIDRAWQKLNKLIESEAKSGDWMFSMNQETSFIEAVKAEEIVYLAPARQVNTAGRLEMLLLGCDQELEDKQPANDLIEQYGEQYVLISPWGVGKWLGTRGRVLIDIINHAKNPFALGDNGGRPFFWPVPHFNMLKKILKGGQKNIIKQAVPMFNGSDPLPVAGDYVRAGSYGVKLSLDEALSLPNLLKALKNAELKTENFGKPMGLIQFMICRIKMALR